MRLGRDSLVVELASNDGYLLQHFLPLGIPVLGIEPAANVAKVAIEKGIPSPSTSSARSWRTSSWREGKRADLIVGNNVLAQVPDLNDFVAGMVLLLKPEGVITLEFPHLERLIAENQFDTIYHEHFSYFSLITIERLAARHGLKLIDVEELPTHGGSLRVYLAHADSRRIAVARAWPTCSPASAAWATRRSPPTPRSREQVKRTKRKLLSFLIAAKDEGKRICGYGAPGKGNTLLNYCGIGTDFLDFTVDRNPYKHGRFTPGMHIPIHPVEAIDAGQARLHPDPALEPEERDRRARCATSAEWGAKFVVPIPEATVIDPGLRESSGHESRSVLRRARHAHPRVLRERAQADDPDRPPADPVARDAVLQPVRAPAISCCASATRPTSSRTSS